MYFKFTRPLKIKHYSRYGVIFDIKWLMGEFEKLYNKEIKILHIGKELALKQLGARYLNFLKNGTTCVHCGKTADIAYVESNGSKPHINLYSDIFGNEADMLTLDHKIPKSKGGPENVSNYQCLCSACNAKKADSLS